MTTIGSAPPAAIQTPLVQHAPGAAKPQAVAGNENATFKTAAEMVEFAENTLDKLNTDLGLAAGIRKSLASPELFDDLRKTRGEAFAKTVHGMLEETLVKAESMAETNIAALRGAYSVSGELTTRDAEGNRTLGRFTLSGGGGGFAVKIDSERGAFVSNNGGAFTSDFARITSPHLRNLPYLKAIADTLKIEV